MSRRAPTRPIIPARRARAAACAGLAVAGLTLAGCGEAGSSRDGAGTSVAVATNTVAHQLVLGAGPECPDREYCLIGLRRTYGLEFKEFRPFDESGGAQTKAALTRGEIDVGLVFTSDGELGVNDWVLLADDKDLQPSDNVTPVVNDSVATAYGADLATVVDGVSAKITTEDLIALNRAVGVDKRDADAVARDFVASAGLAPAPPAPARSGPTIVVGSANFAESEILAQVYLQVLQANGFPVTPKLRIGSREVYFPALERGEVTFMPEYAGTLLTFLDKDQGPSSDPARTAESLARVLAGRGVTAYRSAPAEDKNGFAVTRATADRYHLTKLSDLARPADS